MTLPVGSKLGRYEIVGQIGAGGRGEVYRAKDPRLAREVAIKVLPASCSRDADRLRRFEQEARAASALNHPNITTVYDIGQHEGAPYIVQELLEGETLRTLLAGRRIPPREAVDYALQIAHGLAAAHKQGVVHRDLKPENLVVTRDGRVKILDFGLAKLVQSENPTPGQTGMPTAPLLTEPGVVLGTLGYMSPEQLRGRSADARSDVFAFGAVLYEMLSGKPAFIGGSAADTMTAILKEDPPDLSNVHPDLVPGLQRIVRHCLEKDPERRFQSARDLAFNLDESAVDSRAGPFGLRRPALARHRAVRFAVAGIVLGLLLIALATNTKVRRWILATPKPVHIESVAVLPLRDLSAEAREDYFADGMTEALTANLARIGALKVISGTSAMQYKGTNKPLPQIARELGVDAVLEGTVARVGDRVRITSELINARSDTQLWAKTFERDLRDILVLQGELAREVARQVEAELTVAERSRLTESRRVDGKAYEHYLLGRYLLDQQTEDSLRKALEHFNAALEVDKDYAAPYAGIATYYSILPFHSALSPAEVFPRARAAAQRSLDLDQNLPEAHASLAYIHAYYEWDWAAAEREFRRALELRPSHADVHFSYSRFLAAAGRMDEALAEIRRAEELDPRSLSLKANTALLYYFHGQYDRALTELLEIRVLDSSIPVVHWGIGLVYEQKGMFPEAIAAIQKATSLSASLNLKSSLGHLYSVSGKPDEARKVLVALQEASKRTYVPSYYAALIHAGLGETEQAFESLERAFQERSTVLAYLQLDPRLAPLRSNPRFADLVQRTGRDPVTVPSK